VTLAGALRAHRPPWPSTRWRRDGSPSPSPPSARWMDCRLARSRSKTCGKSSGEIPFPRGTVMSSRAASTRVALRRGPPRRDLMAVPTGDEKKSAHNPAVIAEDSAGWSRFAETRTTSLERPPGHRCDRRRDDLGEVVGLRSTSSLPPGARMSSRSSITRRADLAFRSMASIRERRVDSAAGQAKHRSNDDRPAAASVARATGS